MPTLYSKGTGGNWSTLGTFNTLANGTGTDQVPTNADDVIIQEDDVVTLDGISCVALTVTLNNRSAGTTGGTLQPSASANSKLTVERTITASGTSTGSGAYSSNMAFDMSANSYTCELLVNNVNGTYDSTVAGNFQFKGKVRKRHTTLTAGISAGATSATVADATGWAVGDALVFATTGAYAATPLTDIVTLTSVDTGTGAIGWSGGTTNAHASGCPVGNFSSNLIIGGNTTGNTSFIITSAANTMNANSYVTDVLFRQLGTASGTYNHIGFGLSTTANAEIVSVSNNAFYEHRQYGLGLRSLTAPFTRDANIFYSSVQVAGEGVLYCTDSNNNYYNIGKDTNLVVFRGSLGVLQRYADQDLEDAKLSGLSWSDYSIPGRGAFVAQGFQKLVRSSIWSCRVGAETTGAVEDCAFGDQCFTGADNEVLFGALNAQITVSDSGIQTGGTYVIQRLSSNFPSANIYFKNKNDDPDVQEIYGAHSISAPMVKKYLTDAEHATSSFEFQFNSTALGISQAFDVPVKAATAVRIILFVKKGTSYYSGSYSQPTAVLSGLGITPVTATATSASNNAWERLIIDLAAGSAPSVDGNLRLTLAGNSATAASKCWFSGVPSAPFITRCRHYGYVFDETIVPRTRNNTVTLSASDPTLPTSAELTSAESAAYGITGISVSGGTSVSPVTLSASKTFQQLYDYTQAWCCYSKTNVGYAVPVEGSGTNGSPSLLAKANVTVNTTYTLSGSGSINMGGYTLTTEFSGGSAYTYTGGTWSQATTVPTFSGGTVNIGAAGTYTFTQAAGMILSMTPTAPGTYALGGCSFTGQVDLRNTSGTHAITVELPSGTSYTTANNTGAAITVSTPAVYQSVTVNGIRTTSRVQIYDIEYVFTVSGVTVTPTAGATYTNNGVTYTVRSTSIAGGSGTITAYGTGAPAASGTLTKASGTGDATIAFSACAVGGTELYVGVPGTTSKTWTDGTAAADYRVIRLRVMEDDPAPGDAVMMIDQIIGTCGLTEGTKAVTSLVALENDAVYEAHNVTGSTVTGISIDDDNLLLSVSSGTIVNYGGVDVIEVHALDIYAYETHWLGTDAGIRDEARFIDAIDGANLECRRFKFKNVTSGPAYPVLIVGAYVRDADTGVAASMVDYSGGPIHFAPDHVVNNIVTVGGVNIITGDIADIPGYVPSAAANAAAVWAKTLP